MEKFCERFENSKITLTLRRFFHSWTFPVFAAALILVLYYLNLDLVSYWCICVCGVAILVTCKDATPFLFLLLFLNLPISCKNTPSIYNPNPTDYYTRTANVAQLITIGSILVAGLLARTAISIIKRRFKVTPLLWGLVAVAAAFILNGVLSNNYKPINLMYGCAVAAIYLGIFAFCCGNINIDGKTFKKIAGYFLVLFVVLTIELGIRYIIGGEIIDADGVKHRGVLFFGWGTYNNMGVLIVMSIPAWFYFAHKYAKYGWAFLLGGAANLLVAYFTNSRQAELMGTIVFAACCIWDIIAVKDKKRRINHLCIYGAVLLTGIVICGIYHEKLLHFVSSILDGTETGSGRLPLWKEGFYNNFLHKPLFGTGFYGGDIGAWDKGGSGLDMIPRFYHNTVIQLLASCGIVGLLAFAFHRVQTIISLIKNFNSDRIFIALTMCGIILCGLLDVHMFSPFSALIYAMLVPVLALSEKKYAYEAAETADSPVGAANDIRLPAVVLSEKVDETRQVITYQSAANNNLTEVTMEEERSLKLKDIFKLIGRHIKAVIVVTLAGLLAFTAVIWLWYNRSKKNYSVSYELIYPNSESGTYPDGTDIVASDSISKELLTDIKNGVYSAEENKKEFSGINVNAMSDKGDIKIEVKVESNADHSISRTYTVTALAKYFESDKQAEKFFNVIVNYPVNKMISVIEDNKYGRYLTVYDGATTYEDKITALLDQKKLLLDEYEKVKEMGGSTVTDNSARVTNVINDEQVSGLYKKIEAYYYQLDTEGYISNNSARLVTIEREITKNNADKTQFEADRQKLITAGGSTTAINSYDDQIAKLTLENNKLGKEKAEIENTLAAIERYKTEGTTEYEDKQKFDNLLSGYYNSLQTETDTLKTTLSQIYSKNARVVYVANFKASGGMSLILAAVIGAAAGFIVAAIAVCIAHGEKYKAEKYAVADGQNASAEGTSDGGEKLPEPVEEKASSEEELLTVSGVIGDGVSADGGVIHEEDNLKELVDAEIMAEEAAATDASEDGATIEAAREEIKNDEPAEVIKAQKKPAAKKTTAKPAAKKAPAKSAAKKPAAKTSTKKPSDK